MQLLCCIAARCGNLSRFSLDGKQDKETNVKPFMLNNISHNNNNYYSKTLLVICWNNIIEELEDVPHSEEQL